MTAHTLELQALAEAAAAVGNHKCDELPPLRQRRTGSALLIWCRIARA